MESKVESQGSWPECAVKQRQSGWERYMQAPRARNNVTEWRNESMEKTHNPHYKGFGVSFYDTFKNNCSASPHSQSPGGLTFAVMMESPDQNRNPLLLPVTLLPQSLSSWHYMKHQSDKLLHMPRPVCGALWIHLTNVFERETVFRCVCNVGVIVFADLCIYGFLMFSTEADDFLLT